MSKSIITLGIGSNPGSVTPFVLGGLSAKPFGPSETITGSLPVRVGAYGMQLARAVIGNLFAVFWSGSTRTGHNSSQLASSPTAGIDVPLQARSAVSGHEGMMLADAPPAGQQGQSITGAPIGGHQGGRS